MCKVATYYQLQNDGISYYKSLVARRWYEHVMYTRNTILAMLSSGNDATESISSLMKNQDDIGRLLRPFYQNSQVDTLVELLKNHISMAGGIVTAMMSKSESNILVDNWKNNCQEIFNALVNLNPRWEQTNLLSLWEEHLTLTINEIKFRIDENWTSDLLNFDRILNNIQQISEIFSDGIIKQFPEEFCSFIKCQEYHG